MENTYFKQVFEVWSKLWNAWWNSLKILSANFVRLFNHHISFTSPHTVSHYLPLSKFCGQISENIFFFLDLLVQKVFFNKNQWFWLLCTKNEGIISLFLISQLFHHIFCRRRAKLRLSMKTLLLLTKSPYARKFCFWVCFLSFFHFCFLAYWDHYCKFAGCESLKLRMLLTKRRMCVFL